MRLFTALGDGGMTDLLGDRVAKDHPVIGLIGELDEVTSHLGMARAVAATERTRETVIVVQRDLYQIMAELAFTEEIRPASYRLAPDRVEWLTAETDGLSNEVELPRQFILPGDTVAGAALDVARTVVRRSERAAVTYVGANQGSNPEIVRYLNRLSSLLFMLARWEDQVAGVTPLKAKAPATEG